MTDSPTMAEMLMTLENELEMAKAISGGPAGHEPAYRYLADPPAMPVIQAYREQHPPRHPPEGTSLPVFSVELPPLSPRHPPLVEVLSRALELPVTGKWKEGYFAEARLAEQLRAQQVEVAILTNAHYLAKRPHGVEWLVMFFRQQVNHIPLLLVGEGQQMDELLLWKATAWVVRRFHRIRLPGEPEVQESAEGRAALHRLLGMQDNETAPEK